MTSVHYLCALGALIWSSVAAAQNIEGLAVSTPQRAVEALLDQAMAHHPQILAARATASAAGYDLRTAKWQRFPNISVEMLEVARQKSTSAYDRFYPTINVEQPLWTGGRLSALVKRADFSQQAAIAFYKESALQIAVDVSDSFGELVRLDKRVQRLSKSVQRHQMMVETMQRRVDAGVSPLADLVLAQTRLAQIQQQHIQARADQAAIQERLSQLVGEPVQAAMLLENSPPLWPDFDMETSVEEARLYSPRLQQLQAESGVSKADMQSARAALMPQVSGQYSYNDYQGAQAGLVVRMQFGSGLSRVTAISAARDRVAASDLNIAAAERDLRNQIVETHNQYSAAVTRLPMSVESAKAAHQVHESYLRLFMSGRRSWLDVMNSFQETTNADLNLIDAQSSAWVAMNRLLLLTGRWRLDIKDMD